MSTLAIQHRYHTCGAHMHRQSGHLHVCLLGKQDLADYLCKVSSGPPTRELETLTGRKRSGAGVARYCLARILTVHLLQ